MDLERIHMTFIDFKKQLVANLSILSTGDVI